MDGDDMGQSTEWTPISLEALELADKVQDKIKIFRITAWLSVICLASP